MSEHLTAEEVGIIRTALGLHMRRAPDRNRFSCNVRRETYPKIRRLLNLGFLAEDHAAHYGSMRVFRVTKSGMEAVGVVRPKKDLLDLVPRVAAPLPLAA